MASIFYYCRTVPPSLQSKNSSCQTQDHFLVPGSTIIFFGFIVSLFSFRLVDQPFISFVKGWWPILFLASGLVLISISLAQHTQIENKEKHSSNKDLQKDESSEK
jgi:hypothetical protein